MLPGLHHVTAIAGHPQRNYDFYAGFLGLRLIKKTVNFDDPGAYHLYFGDRRGSPGSIMTFFLWPGAHPGGIGTGQASVTSFAVPPSALGFWISRARSHGVSVHGPQERFGEPLITLIDPDGLRVELVGSDNADESVWTGAGIAAEHAIRGFHSVTLSEEGFEQTAGLLTGTMGFRRGPELGNRFRFETGSGGPGSMVDLLCLPSGQRGLQGAGTVHHIAWRTSDDKQQIEWRAKLAAAGLNVTPVIDRNYFHSIYFREPGGVLFEIATDPPGFTIDELLDSLGAELKLPPQYEPLRAEIENLLPPLQTGAAA